MSTTGVGAVAGAPLAIAGGDQIGTGLREIWTGKYQESLGSRAIHHFAGDGVVGTVGGLVYDIGPTFAAGLSRQTLRIYAFRLSKDPLIRAELDLAKTGHVGFSFDGGKTIFGFGPQVGSMTFDEALAALKKGATFAGQVTNDTKVFERARQLGLNVLEYEYSISSVRAGYAAIGARIDNLFLSPIYSFPGHGGINCAQYPLRWSLPSPVPSGSLRQLPLP